MGAKKIVVPHFLFSLLGESEKEAAPADSRHLELFALRAQRSLFLSLFFYRSKYLA
jgi:hypothetical protein